MNLLDVKKAVREKQLKIVQIGESGSGKTHRALTAVDFGPMFFFDCDGKLANYASSGKISDAQLKNIDYMLPKSTSEIIEKLAQFQAQGDKLKYATIVLDTFSRWNEMVVEEEHKAQGGKLNIPGWTNIKMTNCKFLKQIFSLPCNIIINAHLAEKENAIGELSFTAGGGGSSSQLLPEFVDECHYLYLKKPSNKYTVQGKGSGKFTVVKTLLDSEIEGKDFKDPSLKSFEKFAKIVKPDLTK